MQSDCRSKAGWKTQGTIGSPSNGQSRMLVKKLVKKLEAPPGIEPGMEVLQTSALPLGDGAPLACVTRGRARTTWARLHRGQRSSVDSIPRPRARAGGPHATLIDDGRVRGARRAVGACPPRGRSTDTRCAGSTATRGVRPIRNVERILRSMPYPDAGRDRPVERHARDSLPAAERPAVAGAVAHVMPATVAGRRTPPPSCSHARNRGLRPIACTPQRRGASGRASSSSCHSFDLYAAFAGAWIAGVVPSIFAHPSEKTAPQDFASTVRQLVAHVRPDLIVTAPEWRTVVAAAAGTSAGTAITPLDVTGDGSDVEPCAASPDEIAFVQSSSGTTGLKKGVAITHRAALWQIGPLRRRDCPLGRRHCGEVG